MTAWPASCQVTSSLASWRLSRASQVETSIASGPRSRATPSTAAEQPGHSPLSQRWMVAASVTSHRSTWLRWVTHRASPTGTLGGVIALPSGRSQTLAGRSLVPPRLVGGPGCYDQPGPLGSQAAGVGFQQLTGVDGSAGG